MKKNKYLPINWVNGIKLTEQHFVETYLHEVAAHQGLRSLQLTPYNYGLGCALEPHTDSFELEAIGTNPEAITLRLKYCNALTQSGAEIVYDEGLYGSHFVECTLRIDSSGEDRSQSYYATVSVDDEDLLPIGIPNPQEVPLHHPYVLPKVTLSLISVPGANESYLSQEHVVLAKGFIENQLFVLDTDFIPPVQRMSSNKRLSQLLVQTLGRLRRLESDIARIYSKNNTVERRSPLCLGLLSLCDAVQGFLDSQMFDFETTFLHRPPIYYIQAFNILARSVSSCLRKLSGKEYEQLLQYIYSWTDISPSVLEGTLNRMLAFRYSHLNIFGGIEAADILLEQVLAIMDKMSELEYIGVVRENIIISEEEDAPRNKQRSVWRILD